MQIVDFLRKAEKETDVALQHAKKVAKESDQLIADLEAALREIKVRTQAYADDYESWPLVAGVHDVARKALV